VALPATTVLWQGVSGGEILLHRFTPAYVTRTDDVYGNVMASVAAADPELGHTMCFYGVGNHGGGPTKGAIEYIRDHAHALPGLELRFSTPTAYFAAIADKRGRLPLVTVELQHCFPGCYSVMHDIKQNQRQGEHLLSQAENVIQRFVDAPEERQVYDRRLDAAWDDLLFTQFHDVLSGTSTPSAWGAVRAMQGRARITAEEIALEVTRRWALRCLPAVNAQQIVALNADAEPFDGFLEADPPLDFDIWRDRWLSDLSGQQIPCQVVLAESPQMIHRVLFPAVIPSGGQAHVLVQDGPAPAVSTDTDLAVSPLRLANQCLSVDLGAGGIVQVRTGGRPLLGEGGVRLHLRHDHSDTWTLSTDRFAGPPERLGFTIGEHGGRAVGRE
jgi:alpha-mannosidase